MIRIISISGFICILLASCLYGDNTAFSDTSLILKLSPDKIDMGIFYNGTEVKATADIPICDGAVLVLEAGQEEMNMNRKGRVGGLWLNVAHIKVQNAPKVYILAKSGNLDNICPPEARRELRIGPEYLRRHIRFICDEPLKGSEFDELLNLKTETGTYKLDIDINLDSVGQDAMRLSAVLPVAPTMPPGVYDVVLYCFKDGVPIQGGTARLTIERTGLARLLANLADNRPALYGLLAIAVAVSIGIIMGVIFSSVRGSGH